MESRTIRQQLQIFGLNRAIAMIDGDPDRNIPRIMKWVDRLVDVEIMKEQRLLLRRMIRDRDNVWYRFMKSFWTDIHDHQRRLLFENFFLNACLLGKPRRDKAQEAYRCNIPWAILMDPTSACNLSCIGCWAAEYGDRMSMDYDVLDSIIRQGKELGTYFYIYSGGEPLVRKDDIVRLCEVHSDCMFLAFTNGTLIDEAFADEMLRVGNFVPAISIEGFEEETDARRGAGSYGRVLRAMEILRERRLGFGASLCYTSRNAEVIGSEEYIDFLIRQGCKFAWFFTYMPVGSGAPVDLIARAEQREYMYRQIRAFRKTKPIFTMDFWNDGEYVGGCIAGGRCYLHINANGDIEPCAFIHYSDSNIHEKTLLEAYRSPLFMEYRKNQPFNANPLRPCPLLDNKGKLAEMVRASGARSTDMSRPEDVDQLCAKCAGACDRWAPVADRLWRRAREEERAAKENGPNERAAI